MKKLKLTNGNIIEFDDGIAMYKFLLTNEVKKKPSIRLTPMSFYLILIIIEPDMSIQLRESLINALHVNGEKLEQGIKKVKRIFEIDENVRIIENLSEQSLIELCRQVKNYKSEMYFRTRLKGPESIVFRVTNQCPQNCIYCYADSSPQKNTPFIIPMDVIEARFREASTLGCKDIIFTGGEALLCNKLPELIWNAHKYNITTSTSTKMLIKQDTLSELVNAGLNKLQVSIDTLDTNIAYRLVNKETAVTDALTTIDNALKTDLELTVACVITKMNIETVPELINHLENIGVQNIILKEFRSSLGRGNAYLCPDKKEIIKLKEIIESFNNMNIQSFFHSDSPVDFMTARERSDCEALRSTLTFVENGNVYLCDLLIEDDCCIGNIIEQNILDIWNSDRAMSFVEPKKEQFVDTECEKCKYFDLCLPKRCFMRSKIKSGNIFDVDPLCNVMLKNII